MERWTLGECVSQPHSRVLSLELHFCSLAVDIHFHLCAGSTSFVYCAFNALQLLGRLDSCNVQAGVDFIKR